LRRFLQFTDIRIRLIRPPILREKDQNTFIQNPAKSGHYGIKKVEIPARFKTQFF